MIAPWTNTTHRAPDGKTVVTTTHPGRADWCIPWQIHSIW